MRIPWQEISWGLPLSFTAPIAIAGVAPSHAEGQACGLSIMPHLAIAARSRSRDLWKSPRPQGTHIGSSCGNGRLRLTLT